MVLLLLQNLKSCTVTVLMLQSTKTHAKYYVLLWYKIRDMAIVSGERKKELVWAGVISVNLKHRL